jgi:hypothetical protein
VIELPKVVTDAPEITAVRALVEALAAKDNSAAGIKRITEAFRTAVQSVRAD